MHESLGKRSTPADRIIQILTYNSFEKKKILLEFRGFGNIFLGPYRKIEVKFCSNIRTGEKKKHDTN